MAIDCTLVRAAYSQVPDGQRLDRSLTPVVLGAPDLER